jgi:hypothetical protein
MGEVNNLVLALAIVLLIVSLLGAVSVLQNFNDRDVARNSVQQGEIKLRILPSTEKTTDQKNGYIGLVILPSE